MNAMLKNLTPGISRDVVLVEDVERSEVADSQHQAPTVHDGPELHRVRRLLEVPAAEAESLPVKYARAIERRRLSPVFWSSKFSWAPPMPFRLERVCSAIASGAK